MRFVLAVLAVYGVYIYGMKYVNLDAPVAYAKKTPGSPWAPKINYYAGMAYYQRSEYPKSQALFMQLLLDHPTSQKLPKALIWLGDSASNNHDYDTAKMAMALYIEKFPDGKDIEIAKSRLDMLKYKHGPDVPPPPEREKP